MTTHSTSPIDHHDVAVGYDASPESRRALHWGAEDAVATGRRLAVVTAVEPAHYGLNAGSPILRRFLFTEAHRLADPALARIADEYPSLDARVVVRVGTATTALAHVADEAAVLVLGVRRRSVVSRLMLGSVAHHVLRTATSPVVLVPRHVPSTDLGRCGTERVVAVVGPAAGSAAVAFAIAQGRARHRDVTVVRALRGAGGARPGADVDAFGAGVDAALALARAESGDTRVELRAADTTVREVLEHGVADSDLLVIGNHEPGEARHLLADRAVTAVLTHAHCPVVVVPDGVADAPVTSASTPMSAVVTS